MKNIEDMTLEDLNQERDALRSALTAWVAGCENNKDYAIWCAPYVMRAIKALGFDTYAQFQASLGE